MPGHASHSKGPDQLLQLDHLQGQLPAGLFSLVRALRCMFTGAIDLDDVLIDVMGHGSLLFDGGGNLLVLVDDHAYRAEDVFEGLLDFFRLPHRAIGRT